MTAIAPSSSRHPRHAALALGLLAALAVPRPVLAQGGVPEPLQEVGIDQRLGERVPLDLPLRDEQGRDVLLGDYFRGRPVVLALVYYECPMLCTLILNGLASAMKALPFDAGQQYDVVTLSFDPRETAELAAGKKRVYLESYRRPGAEEGWHFLTGDQESIERLAAAVGFRYRYEPEIDEYAHAAGITVLTPDGVVARYFYGVEYPARDLRLGLVEAADGEIGSRVDQVLLFCFRYDPSTGRYSAAIMNLVRLGGVLTVGAIALFVFLALRRDARRARRGAGRPVEQVR